MAFDRIHATIRYGSHRIEHLLIRATNWVGDAVMSLPALLAVRERWPGAKITVLAQPWVVDLYRRERFADRVLPYTPKPGAGDWAAKWRAARELEQLGCDTALLLPNSFESAAVVALAGIPRRIGYARDGRSFLLTDAIAPPQRARREAEGSRDMAGIAIAPPSERGHEIAPAENGGQTPFSRPQHHENERPRVSRKGLSVPIFGLPISASQEQVIPRFEAFYYLELVRRIGWIDRLPDEVVIRLEGADDAAESGRNRLRAIGLSTEIVGVSPGAAYGTAKRWLPERFAEAAVRIARERRLDVALFGSAGERALCDGVRGLIERQGVAVHNLAGETTLAEFIDIAAACRVFLTNDSGAMHIASALGVPTVTVFGATDEFATGPTGDRARVVREPVECAPCLQRECPIDHRCMTRVSAERVALTALELLK